MGSRSSTAARRRHSGAARPDWPSTASRTIYATCSSRTSTSTMQALPARSSASTRSSPSGCRDRRAAPRRSVPARALGPPPLRGAVRQALGRACTRAPEERARRKRRHARLGDVPDCRDTPPTTSVTSSTERCSPATRRACACRARLCRACLPSARHRRRELARDRRRDQRARAGTARADPLRHPRGRRAHLDRLELELDRAARVHDGMDQDEFVEPPSTTPGDARPLRPGRAVLAVVARPEAYWEKRDR